MSVRDVVISAEGLGKRYRVGAHSPYRTLRESIVRAVRAPFARPPADGGGVVWALRDVGFEVARGEVIGVIGKNGAGKTTLLRILARITRPTEGTATIRGRVGALLETGTGFQRELTGRENVYLNGTILGMRRAEIAAKLDEIVDFAGVGPFLDTDLKHYSTGMQMRLAFSVAAHLRPEILLVDEVLAVGDVEFQKKCMGKMEDVRGEGRTVLLVSHSLGAIRALCARAILLDAGRLAAVGPAEGVIAQYLAATHSDSADQAVPLRAHFSPNAAIRVERVRLLDAVAGGFRVHWRQAISLAVTLAVEAPLTGVSVGVGIRGPEGSHVFTVHHDDDGARGWDFSPGRHEIEVTLENTLRPGFYRVHVGAHRESGRAGHLFAADVAGLEVLGTTADGRPALSSNTGVVNGAATWKGPQ